MNQLQKILMDKNISFDIEHIYDVSISLYPTSINSISEKVLVNNEEITAFGFYSEINNKLYDFKEQQSGDLKIYLEIVDIMLWAIYQEWTNQFIQNKCAVIKTSLVNKNECIQSCLENLNYDEESIYLEKLIGS